MVRSKDSFVCHGLISIVETCFAVTALHPLTVRPGARRLFIGCENYPNCQYDELLAVVQDIYILLDY